MRIAAIPRSSRRVARCKFALPLAGRELKTHFAIFVQHEEGRERVARFGNKLVQQIAFARGQEFGNLLAINGLLQDHFASFELARPGTHLAFLANVILLTLEYPPPALRTFAERLLAGEIELLYWRFNFGFFGPFALPGRPGLELKTDFAFRDHQVSSEWAAFFGNKFGQQIGLAGGEELLHLRVVHRLLKNDASRSELAGLVWADGFFANVARAILEHLRAAFGTFAERFLAAEINLSRVLAIPLPEVELRLELRVHANQPGEGFAHFASKALQRADHTFGDQFLDFADLELPAGLDVPM